MSDQLKLSDDLLYGAEAIRAYLGAENVDQIYYMAREGHWPIGRLGRMLIASKKRLDSRADKITGQAA